MANLVKTGFRWVRSKLTGASVPPIEIHPVASAYGTKILCNHPVKILSTGYVDIAAPTEEVYGICVGVEQYYDGSVIRKGTALPASTTYGTNFERVSLLRIIPVEGQVFRASCDDGTTATTWQAFSAFRQENVEFVAGSSTTDYSAAQLDISTHNTTNTLTCTIVGVPDQNLQDFAATGVDLEVMFNLIQDVADTTGT